MSTPIRRPPRKKRTVPPPPQRTALHAAIHDLAARLGLQVTVTDVVPAALTTSSSPEL